MGQVCLARRCSRPGLEITLPGRAVVEVSQEWVVAGWKMKFVRLQSNQSVDLNQADGKVYLKVISGELANIKLTTFAAPKVVRNTLVSEHKVTAGADGAIFALLTATDQVPDNIRYMDQLTFSGPEAEVFEWQTFYDRFAGAIDFFKGVEAYIVPGFY